MCSGLDPRLPRTAGRVQSHPSRSYAPEMERVVAEDTSQSVSLDVTGPEEFSEKPEQRVDSLRRRGRRRSRRGT